tara:strand:- start:737 stop:910 length:174 start_codon:yes stop_codon:yes gene_type:complete
MEIHRQFKGEQEKELISEEQFLSAVEDSGYWKEGTALKVLQEMGIINTPFAIFTLKK